MRTGIEKSRNLMTVRLADKIGIDKILKTASDFGIEKHINDQLINVSRFWFSYLLDITNAYAIIANGGKK